MEYYTRYRHGGKPQTVVDEFGAALAEALARVARESARRAGDGESAEADALRRGAQSALQYADRMRGLSKLMAKEAPDAKSGREAVHAFANVIHDTGAVAIVRSAAATPSGSAGGTTWHWDWDFFKEWVPDLAEKAGALGDALGNPVFSGIAAALWDVELLTKAFTHDPNQKPKVGLVDGALDPVLDRLGRTEGRLDALGDALTGLGRSVAELGDTMGRVRQEVDAIESKADTLGRLLGTTLMGKPWQVDPRVTMTEPNAVPERGVKEELHGIEALLDTLFRVLTGGAHGPAPGEGPGGGPGGGPGAGPGGGGAGPGAGVPWPPSGPFIADDPDPPLVTPAPEPPPRPRLDPRLKKIYVYEQGVMTPTAVSDERTVNVRTSAFDLSGWLDLDGLRAGDAVEVDVLVGVAGRPPRLYARTRFDGPGLHGFAEFARGQNYLSGDDVRIVMRQVASADAFATPRDIGYQFVVESR
jgi:hypothetical protein